MIKFLKDWETQDAIPDYQTPNRSWVEFAALLHKMGIANHSFFLALHDRDLIRVDPFDDELDNITIAKIANECKINPWYYFREVARVPASSGLEAEYIKCNRAVVCMIWLFFNHITNIQIQPRQTGKSLISDMIKVLILNFRGKDTSINLFTKDEKLKKMNIEKLKEIFDALPEKLDMRTKKDADNTEMITVNALGNTLNTHLPRSSEKLAVLVGRGFTSPANFYDEIAFQTWIGVSYPSSMAAMSNEMDKARRAGSDYGVICTTTAHRIDDRDGKFVYKMINQAQPWDERLYDLEDEETLVNVVAKSTASATPTIYSLFTHRQLGYTDEWLREKIAMSRGSPEEAERDYLCKWNSGTASSPFTPDMADKIRASEIRVQYMEFAPEGYILRWYLSEHEVENYMRSNKTVLGLDTSEATGGDDIGFYLIDTKSLRVVCTAQINETNLITFSQYLGEFLLKYPNVIANIERKSTGATIIDYLIKILLANGIDPFKRLYNRVVDEADEYNFRYSEIRNNHQVSDTTNRYRKLFGYPTAGTGQYSRSMLYSNTLFLIIKKMDSNFGDSSVINQLLSLVYKNGRIDHDENGHDDLVVAMLLAYWLLLFGKNLNHYNLLPEDIMSNLDVGKDVPILDRIRNHEQSQYREQLDNLANQFMRERDELKLYKIEASMKNIERKLILEGNEITTVDQLLRKLKDDKKRNRLSSNNNRLNRLDRPTNRYVSGSDTSSYNDYIL